MCVYIYRCVFHICIHTWIYSCKLLEHWRVCSCHVCMYVWTHSNIIAYIHNACMHTQVNPYWVISVQRHLCTVCQNICKKGFRYVFVCVCVCVCVYACMCVCVCVIFGFGDFGAATPLLSLSKHMQEGLQVCICVCVCMCNIWLRWFRCRNTSA
jgi:hypothetical protein